MNSSCAMIKFIDGEYAGTELELAPYTEIRLGRDSQQANLVFNSSGVSRTHCIIQYNPQDERFRVTDCSSSGTYINSVKTMERGSTVYLSAGDTLKIGHSNNVIQLMVPERYGENAGVLGDPSWAFGASNGVSISRPDGGVPVGGGYSGGGYSGGMQARGGNGGSKQMQNVNLGMGWFKFTIYFQLFAAAFVCFSNAIRYFIGMIYGYEDEAVYVYALFPSLKPFDIFIGVLYICMAPFAIFVRMRLARFRKNGPLLLYVYLGVSLLVGIVANVGLIAMISGTIGINTDSAVSSLAVSVTASIALLVADIIYFNHRKHLFIN